MFEVYDNDMLGFKTTLNMDHILYGVDGKNHHKYHRSDIHPNIKEYSMNHGDHIIF